MSEIPRHWLTFARQDLRMAELAMSEGIYNIQMLSPAHWPTVCLALKRLRRLWRRPNKR